MSEWQPIETAPERGYREGPVYVLLYCPNSGGVREGRAARFPDGTVFSSVSNMTGDVVATHWMPLPEPPS